MRRENIFRFQSSSKYFMNAFIMSHVANFCVDSHSIFLTGLVSRAELDE